MNEPIDWDTESYCVNGCGTPATHQDQQRPREPCAIVPRVQPPARRCRTTVRGVSPVTSPLQRHAAVSRTVVPHGCYSPSPLGVCLSHTVGSKAPTNKETTVLADSLVIGSGFLLVVLIIIVIVLLIR